MGLIPTPSERAAGRLMRAEDHAEAEDKTVLGGAEDDAEKEAPAEKEGEEEAPAKEEEAPAEKKGEEEEAPAKEDEENVLLGAPEGDYEITGLPEDTQIDIEALAMLTPLAKEIGLSNQGMSKLAGVYATQILPHLDKRISDGIEAQAATQRKDWETETRLAVSGGRDADGKAIEAAKDDKGVLVYGGKTYKEVTQAAARALDRFGAPGLREYLEVSGLGNNEALVRFAFKAGQAIKEDDFERGGTSSASKSRVDKYYAPQDS